jgi:hypothetical protein
MAPTRLLWTMIVVAGVGAAIPAHAKVGANLAKKCQAMAWQAHPATLPDVKAAANLRRNYYKLCIARRGIMDRVDPNKRQSGTHR